jgi:hypothetical protein
MVASFQVDGEVKFASYWLKKCLQWIICVYFSWIAEHYMHDPGLELVYSSLFDLNRFYERSDPQLLHCFQSSAQNT